MESTSRTPLLCKDEEKSELVDREKILNELRNYKEEVSSGRGKCILLKGEIGIGKTRLVEEFLNDCSNEKFEVLWGRGLYYEGTQPFLPFDRAFAEYFERQKGDVEEKDTKDSTKNEPANSKQSNGKPMSFLAGGEDDFLETPPDIDREDLELNSVTEVFKEDKWKNWKMTLQKKDMIFSKITELLKDMSHYQPIALFIDDLQWIDKSSANLINHLAGNIRENRILLLGAYRDGELQCKHPPFKDSLRRMREEKLVDIIELPRFDQESTSEFVKDYLGREKISGDFFQWIYRESEGNPYYVKEILDLMKKEGFIFFPSTTDNLEKRLSEMDIPSSIKEITNRKMEGLDNEEKNVLRFASLLGTEFDFDILEKTVKIDTLELADILENLENRCLIEEVDDKTGEVLYRFHHSQTRKVIERDMSQSRKKIFYKIIGEALEESQKSEIKDYYSKLCKCFFEGKNFKKCYEYSKKAGEEALRRSDRTAAVNHFESALQALRKAKDIEDMEEKEQEISKKIGGTIEIFYREEF